MSASSTEENYRINRDDLPALYLSASQASQSAQKWFLRLIFINLSLLISSTLLASFTTLNASIDNSIAIFAAILLLSSMGVTLLIKHLGLEKKWYSGRAIAESVKTLSWRYITCATPYTKDLSQEAVDKIFLEDLTKILNEKKFLSGSLGGKYSKKLQITNKMRQARSLRVSQRKDVYIMNRIQGQRDWYGDNSEKNKRRDYYSFFAVIVSEALALGGLIYITESTDYLFNPVALFATIAVSILAWQQVKQYQELSQAYGLAAHELGIVLEESRTVRTNDQLSDFILDSENAISREHTMWIARKEKL